MLNPPIRNLGVAGIRKAAAALPGWDELLPGEALKLALFNTYIFISPDGGSGGGAFRYMFSRFLAESASLTGCAALVDASRALHEIADAWARLGEWFNAATANVENVRAGHRLPEATAMLNTIAAQEQDAWTMLQYAVPQKVLAAS